MMGRGDWLKVENVDSKWYALRVRSRHEDAVARHLEARGLESFLPLYRSQRRWSDRVKEIDLSFSRVRILSFQRDESAANPYDSWCGPCGGNRQGSGTDR